VEHEEEEEATMTEPTLPQTSPIPTGQPAPAPAGRASTLVSLATRAANFLAQVEDLVVFNGANAQNHPLFANQQVQPLDQKWFNSVDFGLMWIDPNTNSADYPKSNGPVLTLPGNKTKGAQSQIIPVYPVQTGPIRYAENTLNAVASAFSILQGMGYYENYALVLNTFPYADLHSALPTTLIEPAEPISNIVKAGIFGTGTLPPFSNTNGGGLPVAIADGTTYPSTNASGLANILYTGVLMSLSANSMDLVKAIMDDNLDAVITFNQKDQYEKYRFGVVERFCLRQKSQPPPVVVFLFLDSLSVPATI
jgi:hypothetical protein